MALITIVAIALLLKHLKAEALPYPTSNRTCVEFMLPVSVSAHNAIYDVARVDDNIEATQFAVDFDTWSTPASNQRIVQNITVNDTYNISAQLCVPPNGAKKTYLQVATHGLGFDKRYWDVAINASEYSYVDAALAAGYSILTYDRLGTGLSDKPDAYTIVQAPLQLEILRGILQQVRSGELLQHATSSASNTTTTSPLPPTTTFTKTIHIGHSFGSILTAALLSTYPSLTDAAVLTGYIPNPHFNVQLTPLAPAFAAQNNASLFSDRGSGYIVPSTPSALQTGFFSARASADSNTTSPSPSSSTTTSSPVVGGFDPALLSYGFSIRQPTSVGEWLSGLSVDLGAAPGFGGPVQFVLGEWDFLSCSGDCRGVYSVQELEGLYGRASNVSVYLQPGTGHGLTMHRGAQVGYAATMGWLGVNGF